MTDFSFKGGLTPDAILAAYQRKSQLEQEQRTQNQQATAQQDQNWQQIAKSTSEAVSTVVANSKARQKKDFINTLADSISAVGQVQPNPTPALINMGGVNQPVKTASYNPEMQTQLRSLGAVNPEELTKRYIDQQFPTKTSTLSLQPKEVLSNGTITSAGYNPNDNSYYDVNTNEKLKNVTPYNPNAGVDLTDADRKRLMPIAKLVAAGYGMPQAYVNAKGPEKEKLSLLTTEIDPTWDMTKVPQRIATRKDFSPGGKSSQALQSANTVIGHIDTLKSKIDALNNEDIPKYNSIANYIKNNAGKPKVAGYQAAQNAVFSELGRTFQGVGVVTNEERNQFKEALSSASSPDQAKEVLSTYMDLIKSRTDAIKANWTQTMGNQEPPSPFINGKTKKILSKWGYDPNTLEKSDGSQSSDSNPLGVDYAAIESELKRRGIK